MDIYLLTNLLKQLLILFYDILVRSDFLKILIDALNILPKKLGNRKRHRERENFELVLSRFTEEEFKRQTALSKKNFHYLLTEITKLLPVKVLIIYFNNFILIRILFRVKDHLDL
jgi:hypothetical protein